MIGHIFEHLQAVVTASELRHVPELPSRPMIEHRRKIGSRFLPQLTEESIAIMTRQHAGQRRESAPAVPARVRVRSESRRRDDYDQG